jgi:glycosyltransferase involved in cell wall biosynthesis
VRVCLVNYRYFVSSGTERYLFGVTRLLEGLGHEVVPFSVTYPWNEPTPWSRYFVPPIGEREEVYFRQHQWRPRSVKRALERSIYSREVHRALSALLRDARPDVALVLHYVRKLSPAVLVALADHGVPMVSRLSDFVMVCAQPHLIRDGRVCELCVGRGPWPGVRYRCVKGSLPASAVDACATVVARAAGWHDRIDAFVAPSAIMKEKMTEGGWPADKIRVVPTFVEPRPVRSMAGRHERICYVGRIDGPKGLDVLVNAFQEVRRRGHPGLRLVIAGNVETPDARKILTAIGGEALEGVEFPGHLDRAGLDDLLASSLLSVVPSVWYENLPNALLESLACGTPVAASDIGSLRESLAGSGAGLLFKPGDSADLARMLLQTLGRRDDLSAMGEAAAKLARTRYAPERHTQTLVALLEDLIRGKVEGAPPGQALLMASGTSAP